MRSCQRVSASRELSPSKADRDSEVLANHHHDVWSQCPSWLRRGSLLCREPDRVKRWEASSARSTEPRPTLNADRLLPVKLRRYAVSTAMLRIPNRLRLASAVALFSLTITTVPTFADPGNGNDCIKHPDNPGCMTDPPPPSATPELDSLLLFGSVERLIHASSPTLQRAVCGQNSPTSNARYMGDLDLINAFSLHGSWHTSMPSMT